ncbi:MAG: ABC transporter permease [Bdellovibrionales bacterium]|nr:ABC transporter permease [Bdellovibrionales bacterium]
MLTHSIGLLGRALLWPMQGLPKGLEAFGDFFTFVYRSFWISLTSKPRWSVIIDQMRFIGVSSFFIVFLTSAFTGMVIALQTGRAFALFQAETLTGAVTAISLSRELAPVLTALMITARAGSAMAAQLGTMKVTEQIDALSTMAVNPLGYLITPRILAAIMMMPVLTGLFDFIGMGGSYLVGVGLLNIDQAIFTEKIRYYMHIPYIIEGLFKSIFFGAILSSVSCYMGFHAKGGAAGVGRVTTRAVVISSVSILVADYFLTALLF